MDNMTMIEKVKLMSSLASVVSQPEVETILRSYENGDMVYEIFTDAINSKLEELLDSKKEAAPKKMIDALHAAAKLEATIKEVSKFLVAYMETPLVAALTELNRKLGGDDVKMDIPKINNTSANVPVFKTNVEVAGNINNTVHVPEQIKRNEPRVIENVQPVTSNPSIRGFM